MEEETVQLITATLGRMETRLAATADKSDVRRLEGQLEGHGRRLTAVEKAQTEEDAAIAAVTEHEVKRAGRNRTAVEAAAVLLSVIAIVLSTHPFG